MFGLKKRQEYGLVVRRVVPPFWMSTFASGYADKNNYAGLIDDVKIISQLVVSDYRIYYLKKEIEDIGLISFSQWSEDAGKFRNVVQEMDRREKDIFANIENEVKSFVGAVERYSSSLIFGFAMEEILYYSFVINLKNYLNLPALAGGRQKK